LADSSKKLKWNDAICEEGDILHIWKDKRKVHMISTLCNGTIEEVANRFRERIKKPTSVVQYKFMKGVDRADQYLSYCNLPKNDKMEKKDHALLISCALFSFFQAHKLQNPGSILKYK
jgi:hypothetical protein